MQIASSPSKAKITHLLVSITIAIFAFLSCPVYAYAFVDADAYIPPANNQDGVVTTQEERDPAESAAASQAQTTENQIRDEHGIVSMLATDKHNPYNGQIRFNIDIGSEFAEFVNSDSTEGIIIKVTPGATVPLPVISPRNGYYFVGWCQGGVPETPTWDIFTEEVVMTDDTSEGKNMTLYAIYADESGDGYCTCGAWKEGVYKDSLDKIKEDNIQYAKEHGLLSEDFSQYAIWVFVIIIVLATLICAAPAILTKIEKRLVLKETAEQTDNDDIDGNIGE